MTFDPDGLQVGGRPRTPADRWGPMRVLHVISGLTAGGAESVMFRAVTGSGSETVGVVSLTGDGYYGARLQGVGIPVLRLNLRGLWSVPVDLIRLYRLMRRVKPDVVQSWMYHADLVGGIVARIAGVRAVVWGVHAASLDASTTSLSARLAARACAWLSGTVPSAVICCSAVTRTVHADFGYCADRLEVVHNGVDMDTFRPDPDARARVRTELGMGPDDFVVGMLGRWDPVKDHAGFLRALSVLKNRGIQGWKAVLAGHAMDPGNRELQELIVDAGVGDSVTCLGVRSDVSTLMNAFDLHVLPSITESFGYVIVEAMACGVPCVVSDVGISRDIVGGTGWVIPPSEPKRLADAVGMALAESREERAWSERKKEARERVESRFGLADMLRGYRGVWSTSLSGSVGA